jgi:hypothetical protein
LLTENRDILEKLIIAEAPHVRYYIRKFATDTHPEHGESLSLEPSKRSLMIFGPKCIHNLSVACYLYEPHVYYLI